MSLFEKQPYFMTRVYSVEINRTFSYSDVLFLDCNVASSQSESASPQSNIPQAPTKDAALGFRCPEHFS